MENSKFYPVPFALYDYVTKCEVNVRPSPHSDSRSFFHLLVTWHVAKKFDLIKGYANVGLHCTINNSSFHNVLEIFVECRYNGKRIVKYEWLKTFLKRSERQRTKLAILVFLFIFQTKLRKDKLSELKQHFPFFWESIKEPILGPKELLSGLLLAFTDDFLRVFLKMCRIYKRFNILGNSNENEPRTLKHLSRCQVRECVIGNELLPKGLQSLPNIPKTLQEYLKLR